MSQLFNVVFAGEIVAGADPSTVKANVGRLFKVDDAMLGKLFSGQRVALKKNVDQAVAMKMRAAMKQAGAIVHLVAVDPAAQADVSTSQPAPSPGAAHSASTPQAAPATPKPVAATATTTPPPPMTMAQRIAALSAKQDASDAAARVAESTAAVAAGGGAAMKMLPTGARLSDEPRGPEPAAPDVSGISMARPGADLVKEEELALLRPAPVALPDLAAIKLAPPGGELLKPEERPVSVPVVVDVSALSVAPPDTEVLKPEERLVVVPVVVDISALSMAPPGAPLDEIREQRAPVNPDTSHLKLA